MLPCVTEGCQLPSSLSLPGLQSLAHIIYFTLFPIMNSLQAGLSRAQVGKGGFSQGESMPALTQSPLHPQRGGDSWGGRGGQQEQPQASLFSMAFYSYVILLLTHIGIGAVAHGGGSQRRAQILSKGAQREVAASLAKGTFPLLLSLRPPH